MCRLIGLFIGIQLWMIGYVAGRRDEAMHEFTGPLPEINRASERTATEAILRAPLAGNGKPLAPMSERPPKGGGGVTPSATVSSIVTGERILN